MISQSSIFGLLVSPEEEIGGYAFYAIPQETLNGRSLLWENSVVLRKKNQGKHYSRQALFQALGTQWKRNIGWIGGRTQNPIIIRRYASFGPTLFPFDIPYHEDEGRKVIEFLAKNIVEVIEARNLDRYRGVCKGQYGSVVGEYTWNPNEKYERVLETWGFNPKEGDAVLVVCRLD